MRPCDWPAMRDTGRAAGPDRHAYTLLELLIVAVLVSVMMVGVWSLFRTWGDMYERGGLRMAQAQLVRSLCDQFTDDVLAVAYVAPLPERRPGLSWASSQAEAARGSRRPGGNLALAGGADWLALEVLQTVDPFREVGGDQSPAVSEDRSPGPRAPELRYILYSFLPEETGAGDSLSGFVTEMAEADDTEVLGAGQESSEFDTGLLRIVVAHESLDAPGNADASGSVSSESLRTRLLQLRESLAEPAWDAGAIGGQFVSPTGSVGGGEARRSEPLEQDAVPEVIQCGFRYYDGTAWQSSWDSRAAGRLPVAVELQFQLKPIERSRPVRSRGEDTEWVGDSPASRSISIDNDMMLSFDSEGTMAGDRGSSRVTSGSARVSSCRWVVYLEPTGED
jgi:type II secretory pathway pseudopilin PulG